MLRPWQIVIFSLLLIELSTGQAIVQRDSTVDGQVVMRSYNIQSASSNLTVQLNLQVLVSKAKNQSKSLNLHFHSDKPIQFSIAKCGSEVIQTHIPTNELSVFLTESWMNFIEKKCGNSSSQLTIDLFIKQRTNCVFVFKVENNPCIDSKKIKEDEDVVKNFSLNGTQFLFPSKNAARAVSKTLKNPDNFSLVLTTQSNGPIEVRFGKCNLSAASSFSRCGSQVTPLKSTTISQMKLLTHLMCSNDTRKSIDIIVSSNTSADGIIALELCAHEKSPFIFYIFGGILFAGFSLIIAMTAFGCRFIYKKGFKKGSLDKSWNGTLAENLLYYIDKYELRPIMTSSPILSTNGENENVEMNQMSRTLS